MNISAPFIRRPIGTILLAIGVFLLGGVSYFLLPVASLPSSDFPAVFIATQYPGASPENMASTVAAPIERRVGEIAGVTDLSSVNSLGGSVIIALFDLSRNVAAAARDVQAALNAAATDLPTGLPNVPIFRKANPNNIPVLILAVTSESLSPSAVYDAVDTVLIQRISQVAGVSDVSAAGADQPAIRVTADPERLSSMGLGQDDVRTAIVNANALSPTGAIDGQIYGRAIATDDQLKTLDDYKSLVVKNVSGRSVLLSDVANVENGTRNGRAEATFNGNPAILIYVRKQSSANVIETVDHVKALIPDIKRFMPAGIDVSIVNDRTTSIRASVNDMLGTLFATIVLVMMVVFVFLRRITPVAAAAVTVPLALAGTFAMMYLVGFSIDNISLMALATSVGFVVDDAIVMIENIDKAREAGMSPMRAALVGSKQIGFTVISISVSLMAAFIPLLLLGGISGILFREFSVTLAFTIIISTVASLTITPMICANFVSRRPRARSRFDKLVEGVLARVVALYAATLRIVLRRKALMLLVMAGTIGLTVFLFAKTPKGLFPEDDTDLIMGTAEGSSAISYQALVPLVHRAAEMIHDDPAVGQVGASVGNTGSGPNSAEINQGKLLISLKPVDQLNGQSTAEIVARLRKKLKTIVGLDTFLIPRADLHFGGRDTKAALSLTLTDSDYGELTRLYPAIEERIKKVAGTADVNNDHESSGLQANVVVDRLAASRMLVTMANIDNSLNNAFAQRQISTIYSPRNQYRVVLESPPHQQRSLDDILSTYVPAGVSLQTGTALSGGSVQTALNTSPNNGQAQTSTTGASTQTSTSSTSATSAATANITAVQGTTSGGATVTANPTGQIRLQSMAHIEVGTAPLSVNHQGQFPEVTISFNLKPGAVQQQVSNAVLAAVAEMHLPDTLHYAYTGDALLAMQSAGGQGPLLWAALISVYIVLGVLYESFAHPLTIISTLPSAGLGALLALNITGTELSLIAFIGLILLIGIVKKNGIMLVDFALNAERQRGLPAEAAIYEACIERFRPILMTTLAALLGAMPLILSMGPGSALRRPLGITIAGGLIVSQMLTLYTTPVIYLYLDKLHHRLRRMRIPRRFGRGRGVAPAE